jgi:predicted nucleotidyltransferase
MGGSGGGFFPGGRKAADLRKQVRQAEDQTTDDFFETAVSDLIDSMLSQVNKRDAEAVKQYVQTITKAIEAEIEGSVNVLFGGSVAKRTYVDGLSDVDALVILNQSELTEMSPIEVRGYFAKRLRERLPQTKVEEGALAVTVTFSDATIQLLPAVRVGKGVKLPQADSTDWSPVVHPERFAQKLTKINQEANGKVIPAIKIAKQILSQLPENQKLSGYHVESLAISVFNNYTGTLTTKAMLRHFFSEAPMLIRSPIKDSTGQSVHVDDYLGATNSAMRRVIADSVARFGRALLNADGAKSIRQWQEILGEL